MCIFMMLIKSLFVYKMILQSKERLYYWKLSETGRWFRNYALMIIVLIGITALLCLSQTQLEVNKKTVAINPTFYSEKDVIYSMQPGHLESQPVWYLSPTREELPYEDHHNQANYYETYRKLLAVYAAFYHPVSNSVRILINMDLSAGSWIETTLGKHSKLPYKFFCAFFGLSDKLVQVIEADFSNRYLIDCPVLNGQIPKSIFLFRNDSLWGKHKSPPWLCPVTNLKERKDKVKSGKNMAICLSSLSFRTLNWFLLLQFMEHHMHLGFSKVFVFQKVPLDPLTNKILKYYRESGFVDHIMNPILFPWCPLDPSGNGYDGVFCGRMTFRNFCNLHATYHYKYVAFLDFDELIMPYSLDIKLNTLLMKIDKLEDGIGSFQLNNQYHITGKQLPNIEYDLSDFSYKSVENCVENNLPISTWNDVSNVLENYWPKVVVKPETVQKLFVHEVKSHFSGWRTRSLTQDEAYLQHFKNMSQWRRIDLYGKDRDQVGELYHQKQNKEKALQYVSYLIKRTSKVFHAILTKT